MKRNKVGTITILIAVLLLTGCAATRVTSFWKDPNYQRTPHKVLVVALVKNPKYRMALEDEFAFQMNKKGIDVTAGSKAFPVRTPGSKDELLKYLRDNGYDTFLLVRIVAEKDLVVNTSDTASDLSSSYSTTNSAISSPDTVVKERIAMTEANFYDVDTGKLFWTASSQTTVDEVNHALIADYVTQILKQMQSNGLVQ
jgi:hypothetical protein